MPTKDPIRRRQRPQMRSGRPTLTADIVADAALAIAGTEGFPQVTMRRVAEDLSVTVRALYNYVADRQELIDLAAHRFLAQWPEAEASEDWQAGVRQYCSSLRELYRKYPRALTVALDESVRTRGVHRTRLSNPESFLKMMVEEGLSLSDALAVHEFIGIHLFGHAMLVDFLGDRASLTSGSRSPVPEEWIDQFPDESLEYVKSAQEIAPASPDVMFDYFTDLVIGHVDRIRST